jgi:hypothetical protein
MGMLLQPKIRSTARQLQRCLPVMGKKIRTEIGRAGLIGLTKTRTGRAGGAAGPGAVTVAAREDHAAGTEGAKAGGPGLALIQGIAAEGAAGVC